MISCPCGRWRCGAENQPHAGIAELLPGARQFAESLQYPRYYLDFETIAPAVPIWPGTRPYETLPIQWSCHYEAEGGELLL